VIRQYTCAAIEDKMMKAKVSKKIEEIMDGMKCPKDFRCAESGFERLCKVETKHFCTCPLRVG
jgi:hypothetical protein